MAMSRVNTSRIQPAAMETLEPRWMLAALPMTFAEYSSMADYSLAELIELAPRDRLPDETPGGEADVITRPQLPGVGWSDRPAPVYTAPEGLIRTGVPTDLAITGSGMFVVDGGGRFYTRNGHFQLDYDDYLVTADGKYVMGYGVDADFNLIEGDLTRLQIPINDLVVARQTSQVVLDGQLGGDDLEIATQGSILQSSEMTDSRQGPVTPHSRLVDLLRHDPNTPALAAQVFFEGTTLTFEGQRGYGRLQGPRQLDVDADTTVQELMDFMVDAFGINIDPSITPAGGRHAGAAIVENVDEFGVSMGTWSIQITGNVGEENQLQMGPGGLQSNSLTVPGPMMFWSMGEGAMGTSRFMSFDIYDSLGNPQKIDLTFVLESEDNTGRTWRFFANSLDDTDHSNVMGTGTIHFDLYGKCTDSTGTVMRLDLYGRGVQSPIAFTLDLSRIGGVGRPNEIGVQMDRQDGEAPGTLTDYVFAEDGVILGRFNNGSTRLLGQVALTLPRNVWIHEVGDGLYQANDPGQPIATTSQGDGAGQVAPGFLEQPEFQRLNAGRGRWYGIDLAISGDGMFVVDGGGRFYTRNGHVQFDGDDYLVTDGGKYLIGYGVDADFNLIEGQLSRLQVPIYGMVVARQTSQVVLDGRLGGDDLDIATQGTILQSGHLIDASRRGGQVTPDSKLLDLLMHDPHRAGPGSQGFFDETTLTVEGQRGQGRLQGPRQLDVDVDTTVQDLMDFMVDAFGINVDPSITPAGGQQAGASIVEQCDYSGFPTGTWAIQITGNVGEENGIRMSRAGLQSSSMAVAEPLAFQTVQDAVGGGVFTSFDVYDSLGAPHEIDLTFVLESEDHTGRTWRFFANSVDDSDRSSVAGSGTIQFDLNGRYVGSTGALLQLDLDIPMTFEMDLSGIGGIARTYEMGVQVRSQNGEPPGMLVDFDIAPNGMIVGEFNNGATRLLGQIALALPRRGLIREVGNGLYRAKHRRKSIPVTMPKSDGAGEILIGHLDQRRSHRPKRLARRRWRTDQSPRPFDLVDLLDMPARRTYG